MQPGHPPFYFVYGERSREPAPLYVHVERVRDRDFLHHGRVRQHSHPHLHQLSFWTGGSGRYFVETDKQPLECPALTWMPAGVIHGFEIEAGCDAIVTSMSDDFAQSCFSGVVGDDLLGLMRAPLVMAIADGVADRLERSFRELEVEYAYPSWGQAQMMAAHVQTIFITIARLRRVERAGGPFRGASGSLLSRFLATVDETFKHGWTVEAYARHLGTTPYLLNQATRAGAGASPSDLHRARVLLEAKRLLLYTMLNVAEVGFAIGMEDPAHFVRMFRRAFGVTPSAWRTSQRQRLAEQISEADPAPTAATP